MNLSLHPPRLNTAAAATHHLLLRIGVPVTISGVEAAWERGSESSSLYAIGRQLQHWRVPHLCLEVEADGLDELPLPFIAHIDKDPHFIVVIQMENDRLRYVDGSNKERWMHRSLFLSAWRGHVLLAERTAASGETDFQQNRRREKSRFVLPLLIALTLLLALSATGAKWLMLLLLLKTAGIAVSTLLLLAQTDARHPLAAAFCSEGKGCTKVMDSSKASSFFSWSEAGLLYFLTGFAYLLWRPASLLPLAVLDGTALLFVPYSLYLQKFVARAWCRLCLTVLLLVSVEAALYFFSRPSLYFRLSDVQGFMMTVLLCVLLLRLVKTAMGKSLEARRYRRGYRRLKYDPAVFRALLRRQKNVFVPDGLGLTIGDPSAEWHIVQVCHPFCRPCARAHQLLEELQAERPDLCLRILFQVSDDGDVSALPVLHFLALQRCRPDLLPQALADWYAGQHKSIESFTERYPADGQACDREQLLRMDEWCRSAEIRFTPTLFVNGRQLPAQYDASDLHLVLEE